MTLADARQLIESSFERMRALYGQPVFNEWMILAPGAKRTGSLAYVGPRAESFRTQLPWDVQPLITQAAGQKLEIGDFDFTTQGTGTRYDAILKLAEVAYLVCNNTEKSMLEIRADPRWLKAQGAFFEMSEKFRHDPLVVDEPS
jgi:hypothetical protein